MRVVKRDLITAVKLIQAAKHIVIISHDGPDGDTLGCNLGLSHALRKQTDKAVLSVCKDKPSERFQFLPGASNMAQSFEPSNFDLVIAMDIAHQKLCSFLDRNGEVIGGGPPVLNIDHHHGNSNYGKYNLVVPEAAAVTLPVYYILKLLKLNMTPDMATCLLAGIYYDTGSFTHSNTNTDALELAAKLTTLGADIKAISNNLFNVHQLNKLRLWGRALERLKFNGKQITTSVLTNKDFAETDTKPENFSGLIDYLNMIPQSKMLVLLHEDLEGNVRGSLRTQQENVDVSKIAGIFGGGGHKKASGFILPGEIKQRLAWEIRGPH